MNLIRFYVIMCIQLCHCITFTSPNKTREMGTQTGDRAIKNGEGQSMFSTILIQLYVIYLILCHTTSHGDQSLTFTEWLYFIIIIGGTMLRVLCYITLNHMFTFGLGLRANHTLVTTGPYRWLVHPSYTGQIVCILGMLLFLNVGMLFIGTLLCYMTLTAIVRIYMEETAMLEHFGDAYQEYLATRWRAIPFVI